MVNSGNGYDGKVYKTILHTYKDDFPLLAQRGKFLYASFDSDIDAEWDSLILEMSELSRRPAYSYITRHSDDATPKGVMDMKKSGLPEFVKEMGDANYTIPTAWFVIFAKSPGDIEEIKGELDKKGIRYWENYEGEMDSIESFRPDGNYCVNEEEAREFFKFLHHTTQISIDLLRTDAEGSKEKLRKLWQLEIIRGGDLEGQMEELKSYLSEKSEYYIGNIKSVDEKRFWEHFTIVHMGEKVAYSWPHFLFNTVGRSKKHAQ